MNVIKEYNYTKDSSLDHDLVLTILNISNMSDQKTLSKLSKHLNPIIRSAIARNNNTDIKIKLNLIKDPIPYVRRCVDISSIPKKYIEEILKNETDSTVIYIHIINIENAGCEINEYYNILINNKHTPDEVLNKYK